MNITYSGINTSKKAKIKATNAFGDTANDVSSVTLCDRSRVRTSIHTITVKESPQKTYTTLVGFGDRSQCSNQPHTPPKIITKRPSPISKITSISNIPIGQGLKSSQSVSHLSQPQGILVTQDKRQGSKSRQKENKQPVQPFETIGGEVGSKKRSSIKPRLSQDRHFVKVQITQQSRRLSSTKMLPAPPSMRNIPGHTVHQSPTHHSPLLTHNSTSHNPSIYKKTTPTKHQPVSTHVLQAPVPVLKQIQHNKITRQVELQRKIKVLEIRVGQLHLQKGAMETKMNELIIRLQYENNFLKEKLNSYPSLTQINGPKHTGNISSSPQAPNQLKVIDQVLSQPSQNSLFFTCPIRPTTRKSIQNSISSDSSRSQGQQHKSLNIEFVNTQEHYFNTKSDSQEVLGLRHKLLEVEEMLSKEVGKNLQLLEEMAKGQKIREEMSLQVKRLQSKVQQLTQQLTSIQIHPPFTTQSTSTHLATQTARITGQFQDKILSLQMQISWLNEKLQQAEKFNSQVKLELGKFHAVSKVELVNREDILTKLEGVKENAELREQIQGLKQQVENLRAESLQQQHETVELKQEYEKSLEENKQLRQRINCLTSLSYKSSAVPEQVIQQHEQTIQILESTIKSLQNSLSFSQQSIHQLVTQKIDLQSKIHHLQLELSHFAYKEQQYELEIQTIGGKLHEIGELVEEKTKEVEELNRKMCDKDWQVGEKESKINRLQLEVEALRREVDDAEKAGSTQNSYYDRTVSCLKCEQMRNNLVKLNSYLIHSQQNERPITAPFSSPTFRPL